MSGRRRHLAIAASFSIAAVVLTACGGASAEDEENVQLRFTWWGGDSRHDYTQEIIDEFQEEYPHIQVSPEFGEWSGYWDQLATQGAAQDLPDVIQMELRYMREYISSEQFLPLDDVPVEDHDSAVVEAGMIDGELYGIPTGSTVPSIVANRAVFEEAGVDFPDDETWTWEQFHEIAREISENSEAVGLARPPGDFGFEVWLRQHADTNIVTEDGDIGYTAEESVPYFEMISEMSDSGAMSSPAQSVEDRGGSLEQSLVVNGGAAMHVEWDTVIMQLSGGQVSDLEPLRFPTATGSSNGAELFYKPTMFYSASATSDHPEEAQMLIDYLVNSEEGGTLTRIDRGIPGNEKIREAILPELDEGAQQIVDFQNEIAAEVAPIPPVPPVGYGAVQDIIYRFEEEVLFERMSPEEAAEAMAAEIESAIS